MALIDTNEAVEHFRRVVEATANNNVYNVGFIDALEFCIATLSTMPASDRWIPCSERMPDVAQRVLLSARGMVMVGMLHSFGKYRLEPTGFSYVYPKDKIDAWMPLPEPYKGDNHE